MVDLGDFPGGGGGVLTAVGATVAAIVAGWRMFKTWAPSDANAAANSSAQIAALDRYEKMLEDERAARKEDDARHAAELAALRAAWAQDVQTRSADLAAERTARLQSDALREKAMEELWTLRGQVNALTQQVQNLQATVTRLQGGT